MMDKWKALSQDNKVKLIIVILAAVFAVVGYFWKTQFEPSTANPATAAGDSIKQQVEQGGTGVIHTGEGNVTITPPGSP